MSSRPYMPFYVGDHVAATSHLSAEEHGALCSLLFAMWRTEDGTLPNDLKALARGHMFTRRDGSASLQQSATLSSSLMAGG